jgi:hypothetical protein
MGMWEHGIIEGNELEAFEVWCDENIENEEQKELLDKVKNHVDIITFTLGLSDED